jgi:two-component system chemotaxis sensor kinase CheA
MMEEFKVTYFEECEDRLQEAEQGLSLMLDDNADGDTIDMVFRAIHSIKGGAGAFAFERLVVFAHRFETVLDYVREGKLHPNRDDCNIFLTANDIVAAIIEMEREGENVPKDFGDDILAKLAGIEEKVTGQKVEVSQEKTAQTGVSAEATERTWAITFRPEEQILKTGNDPQYILQALQELGEVKVTPEYDELPSLNDISPESCYIGWRIVLKTCAPEEEIREVFDFVEDFCELSIEMQNVPPGNMPERRKNVPPADQPVRQARRKEDREADVSSQASGGSIRVDLNRIDNLVNLVGEMVIAQSMLQEQIRWLPEGVGGKLSEGVSYLSRHMRDLQDSVMSVRAQPIKSVFTRMPRIIREVSAMVGKDVRLQTFGEETEVDKTVLENLIDPLTHMIRNSIDHGIEKPEARLAAGKPAYGNIELSARHKSGRIIIEIVDDGKGINREAVKAKALAQGLIAEDSNLTDNEIDNLIFKAGFSTAEAVSEVSGRGVGMDVVKRNISALGGRISLISTPGKGCRMTLSLPLTLAVMDGMIVSVGSQRFVLPTINIVESFRPAISAIGKVTNDVCVIKARGEYVRIVPLHKLFRIHDAVSNPEDALMILLESDEGDRIAVMVDDVLGQQQVVIKSLETNFAAVDGISAATILGNGDVALILDVPGLSDMPSLMLDLPKDVKFGKNIQDIENYKLEGEVQVSSFEEGLNIQDLTERSIQ